MEGFLNLLRLFWGVGKLPYISRIHTAYIGEYLHFRYLKCLVNTYPLKIAGWKTIFRLIPGRLFDSMSIFQCVLFAPQFHQTYVLRCISPIEETPVMWTAQAVVLKMLGEFRAVRSLVMSIHFRCLDDHFSLLHMQVGIVHPNTS